MTYFSTRNTRRRERRQMVFDMAFGVTVFIAAWLYCAVNI
jgi:hypothetical protein